MRTMIALQAFDYAQKPLKPEDEFECDEKHVRQLQIAGRAKLKDPSQEEGEYQTRVMRSRATRH